MDDKRIVKYGFKMGFEQYQSVKKHRDDTSSDIINVMYLNKSHLMVIVSNSTGTLVCDRRKGLPWTFPNLITPN
jgi:hypothetical protein